MKESLLILREIEDMSNPLEVNMGWRLCDPETDRLFPKDRDKASFLRNAMQSRPESFVPWCIIGMTADRKVKL